jgi:hypothetical protein
MRISFIVGAAIPLASCLTTTASTPASQYFDTCSNQPTFHNMVVYGRGWQAACVRRRSQLQRVRRCRRGVCGEPGPIGAATRNERVRSAPQMDRIPNGARQRISPGTEGRRAQRGRLRQGRRPDTLRLSRADIGGPKWSRRLNLGTGSYYNRLRRS